VRTPPARLLASGSSTITRPSALLRPELQAVFPPFISDDPAPRHLGYPSVSLDDARAPRFCPLHVTDQVTTTPTGTRYHIAHDPSSFIRAVLKGGPLSKL
jgi:hypothetical protein